MKRWLRIYIGIVSIAAIRKGKQALRSVGEDLKRLGRILVHKGEDNAPHWSLEVFLRCYLVDVELHIGTAIYCGPMYAMYCNFFNKKDFLIFKLNWVAERSALGGPWEYRGFCAFKLGECGPPIFLPGGDVWFSFPNGHAVIYLGEPTERLLWKGEKDTPRVYTWF